jgi:CBS domain-containing protein
MRTTTKPLMLLTAADVMTENVVMIPREMSIRHAAHLLGQSHISGAPVVDDQGHCTGVISATDFIAWTDKGEQAARHPVGPDDSVHSPWQMMDADKDASREEVEQYMTPDPVTIPPSTTIGQMARMMVDAHIHRLVVVTPDNRPIGIVSSTDVLAALARADQRLEKKG